MFYEKCKYNHNETIDSEINQTINTEISSQINFNWNFNFKKKTINNSNIPILKEIKDMRMNILKECTIQKFDSNNNNISNEELKVLYQFKKDKPFKIIHCDKNVGFLFIS